jgi:carbonic anhydrase
MTGADEDRDELATLLENNRQWAADMVATDAEFFRRLAAGQSPRFCWIGCADSRVPANQILRLPPGAVFVHRNVSNLVVHTDLNCLSVLQFAVEVLQVAHVIVTGHYGCGGVRAALENQPLGLIDNWLRHVQDVAQSHAQELGAIGDFDRRADRLCELNVAAQVQNVVRTTIVRDAWARGQELAIHGLVYRLTDGLLHDLDVTVTGVPPA